MLIEACAHQAPSYLCLENLDVHFLMGLQSQGFHYFVSWTQEQLFLRSLLSLQWVLKVQYTCMLKKHTEYIDIQHYCILAMLTALAGGR